MRLLATIIIQVCRLLPLCLVMVQSHNSSQKHSAQIFPCLPSAAESGLNSNFNLSKSDPNARLRMQCILCTGVEAAYLR